jgi:hypothetical protein
MVEVRLPNSCESDASLDRQNRPPAVAIIIAALKVHVTIASRNDPSGTKLDGHTRISGRVQVTNLVEIAESGECSPQGAGAETENDDRYEPRRAHHLSM